MTTFKQIGTVEMTGRPIVEISGDSIDELIDFCMPRIRQISQEFYKKELRNDLSARNVSNIDPHAGMEVYYTVILKPLTLFV